MDGLLRPELAISSKMTNKVTRREFMGLVGGVGSIGALALASGEPKRIVKSSQSAIAALDSNYLQVAGAYVDAADEYRDSLGVKKLPVGQPKYTVNSNYQRFDSTGLMSSSVHDWYVVNKAKAKVDQSWYTRMEAIEKQMGTSLVADDTTKSQVAAKHLANGDSGWTLLDQAFSGSVGMICSNVTYPATPGMGINNPILWGSDVNQPARGFQSWYPLVNPTYKSLGVPKYQVTDPAEMSRLVKKVGTNFGADLIRVGELDRRWVWTHWYDYIYGHTAHPMYFSDEADCPRDANGNEYTVPTILSDGTQIIPSTMNRVICMTLGEKSEYYATCPEPFYSASNTRQYSKAEMYNAMMATFIRGLGYSAIPILNDTGSKIPSMMDAGIGEQSRIDARIATPEFGTMVRMYEMITDLPLAVDNPIDFQFTEFCQDCKKCAIACPGKALSMETNMTDGSSPNDVEAPLDMVNNTGKTTYYGNRLLCYHGAALVGSGCAICKRACPWNHKSSDMHDRGKWMAINLGGTGRTALLDMYDAFGYGQEVPASNWWNSPIRPASGWSTIKDSEE
jgi:reductive dehalogenase